MAITVDDPFMWKGAGFPPGYTPGSVMRQMCDAFDAHDITGVYSFVSTAPTDDNPEWLACLDEWTARGHHVAAHTHSHASLNWTHAETYIADIDRNMNVLQPWLDRAPSRYFRYAFDMWGDEQAKTDRVQLHLARRGYVPAPISTWFYDVQFLVAYIRSIVADDEAAAAWLRQSFADTAVAALRNQAEAAHAVFGRHPAHIALIHGTPITGDAYGQVLSAYSQAGVEFISLEEAMTDPANQIVAPVVTRYFRNSTQKWAEHAGVTVADTPPQILHEVRGCCVFPGMDEETILGPALVAAAAGVGTLPDAGDLDWQPPVVKA